jgi:hypothetical protein
VRVLVEPGMSTVLWVGLGMLADVVTRYLMFRWLTPSLGVAGIMLGQGLAPFVPIALYLAATRNRPGFVGSFALGRSRGLPVATVLGCAGLVVGALAGPAVAQAFGLDGKLAALCAIAVSGLLGVVAFGITGRLLRVPLAVD